MNNNYDYNNYNDYNSKEEANNENKSEDISLYNDGEDKKPKLVIIIASIIGALILILIFAFACTKLNKKSSNNYLSSLSVTNAEMTPQFDKMTLEYNVTTTEDTVAIKCSAEHKKAYTSGCDKRIYLQDECVEHIVSVTSQTKQVRKYELKICKQAKEAPIIKEVKKTPTTFTSSSVKVEVIAESKNKLHEEAYSFDGGKTYQKENSKTFTSNTKGTIVVRDKRGNSTKYEFNISKIDKTVPKVTISGNTSPKSKLTATVTPASTASGYKYQWYKGTAVITGETKQTYTPSTSGTYYVEVTTGSGKKVKSTGKTIKDQIKPTVTISGSSAWTNKNVRITSTIRNPGSIKINGYKWYKDNKEIGGATSKTYSAGSSGNYKVVVSTGAGNITSGTVKINIDKTAPYTPKIADNSNNKEVECHIINDGEIIGKGTSTTKHTACIGQVASSFNLNVVENDIGGSGMSSKCDIVWEHDGDKKACPIYGNYSSLDINISENYKMTGYNGIKWETINISKKPICANGATYVIYLKRCYDKAGNVSNMLFSFVSRNR